MSARIQALLIAAVSLLLAMMAVVANTTERERAFERQQRGLQQTLVKGAAYAVSQRLLSNQQQAHLFVDEYRGLISQLAVTPQNEALRASIRERLQARFPDLFTFMITTADGRAILEDIETKVGQVCLHDIQHYSGQVASKGSKMVNQVFIHPNPVQYHYDLMVMMNPLDPNSLVFFTSLGPNGVMDVLKSHQIPGHQLMLVKKSDPSLIEVTTIGLRNELKRDIRLRKSEARRIHASESIPGADWQLIDLQDEGWAGEYRRGLWIEAAIVLLIYLISVALLVLIIFRLTRQRQ